MSSKARWQRWTVNELGRNCLGFTGDSRIGNRSGRRFYRVEFGYTSGYTSFGDFWGPRGTCGDKSPSEATGVKSEKPSKCWVLSGEGGFEPSIPYSGISVFETDAFNRSATSPNTCNLVLFALPCPSLLSALPAKFTVRSVNASGGLRAT